MTHRESTEVFEATTYARNNFEIVANRGRIWIAARVYVDSLRSVLLICHPLKERGRASGGSADTRSSTGRVRTERITAIYSVF